MIRNGGVGRFGGFVGFVGASTRLEARGLGGRTSMEVGAKIYVPMLIFSMEAGTYVYARMKVSAKTSEPHRRSMDVGTKIDEDQCFSMEVDTRVPTYVTFCEHPWR